MIKYPKTIEVLGETYKIKFVRRFKDDTVGLCDPNNHTITILKGMTKKETLCTFIHEVLHALSFEGDFKIKHKTIYSLERAIFELIMDNFL